MALSYLISNATDHDVKPGRQWPGTVSSLFLVAVGVLALSAAMIAQALASTDPAMNVDGNNVNITAAGPNRSLKFYWAINGTPTWHPEVIAPAGSVN
jgi:hypothetical protein